MADILMWYKLFEMVYQKNMRLDTALKEFIVNDYQEIVVNDPKRIRD